MHEVGSVVRGVIERLWRVYGKPRGMDWESFLSWSGAEVKYRNLPDYAPYGATRGKTIFLHRDLSKRERALTAYHEVGHIHLHDGDVRWWLTRPQGHITAAKFERQAEEFAKMFPDWSE